MPYKKKGFRRSGYKKKRPSGRSARSYQRGPQGAFLYPRPKGGIPNYRRGKIPTFPMTNRAGIPEQINVVIPWSYVTKFTTTTAIKTITIRANSLYQPLSGGSDPRHVQWFSTMWTRYRVNAVKAEITYENHNSSTAESDVVAIRFVYGTAASSPSSITDIVEQPGVYQRYFYVSSALVGNHTGSRLVFTKCRRWFNQFNDNDQGAAFGAAPTDILNMVLHIGRRSNFSTSLDGTATVRMWFYATLSRRDYQAAS